MPDEQEAILEGTAAPSEEVTTATESATGEQQEPQPEGEANKGKGGFQRKIDKLTSRVSDAQREAEFWRQEALRTKPVETKTEAPTATAEPKEDDFETHSAYVKALTKYTAQEAVEAYKAEQRTESVKTHQKTAAQTYQSKEQEYKATVPDFDEVLAEADFPVSQAVLDEIVSSDNGPAFKYFLAKNPDEAERLSKLAPVALAREVGRLESRFTTAPQKTAAKVTNAPAPPNPVGKSSASSAKSIYEDDLSPKEYQALRRKQYPNLR